MPATPDLRRLVPGNFVAMTTWNLDTQPLGSQQTKTIRRLGNCSLVGEQVPRIVYLRLCPNLASVWAVAVWEAGLELPVQLVWSFRGDWLFGLLGSLLQGLQYDVRLDESYGLLHQTPYSQPSCNHA